MYFDNYFVQVAQGNSSDAEFMTFTSMYPQPVGASLLLYPKNDYISLPKLLKDIGYNSFVIHGDIPSFWGRGEAYPAMGIDKLISKNELANGSIIGMGLSDSEVYKQAIPIIEQAKKPFMSMIITLSGHHPFILPESQKELSITPGEYSQVFVDYLQSQHYADKEIGRFLDTLAKDGILDNSLLVVYGDHFGSGWTDSDIQQFLSISAPLNEYKQMELKKVPLIIRFPKAQIAGDQHQSGGQMDLLPTIANLMGLERRKMIYFGQDLLNEKDGFSIFRYYTGEGSFATNDCLYLGSNDGIFEHGHAYDRKTGQEIDVELLRGKYNSAKKQLELSDHLIKGNAIPAFISGEYGMNFDKKVKE
jgi:phosphoglycerol transferase MdoB-like AlkP superfamily enzyme